MITLLSGNKAGERKVKETVIKILTEEWPLTLKELYFAIIRQHALNVSYQAVHKSVKQLVEEGIIIKENKRYSINVEWIRQIQIFGKNLEEAYAQPKETLSTTIKELEQERKTNQVIQ